MTVFLMVNIGKISSSVKLIKLDNFGQHMTILLFHTNTRSVLYFVNRILYIVSNGRVLVYTNHTELLDKGLLKVQHCYIQGMRDFNHLALIN